MRVYRCLRLIIMFTALISVSGNTSAKQFRALLFTKTAGWHHPSIVDGVTAMRELSKVHHFEVDWHEGANQFNDENLAKYDVVIFLLTTGNVLNEVQQKSLKTFINQGKGFVGIHSASDTEYDWPWYRGLVGRNFVIHPAVQTAKITVIDTDFPGVEFMPKSFLWTDEYYEFTEEHSDNLKYILTVDESTYSPEAEWGDIKSAGMGKFHPVAWYQEYDGGRSFYTALGHLPANYSQPLFLSHLYGGIYWAATGRGISASSQPMPK